MLALSCIFWRQTAGRTCSHRCGLSCYVTVCGDAVAQTSMLLSLPCRAFLMYSGVSSSSHGTYCFVRMVAVCRSTATTSHPACAQPPELRGFGDPVWMPAARDTMCHAVAFKFCSVDLKTRCTHAALLAHLLDAHAILLPTLSLLSSLRSTSLCAAHPYTPFALRLRGTNARVCVLRTASHISWISYFIETLSCERRIFIPSRVTLSHLHAARHLAAAHLGGAALCAWRFSDSLPFGGGLCWRKMTWAIPAGDATSVFTGHCDMTRAWTTFVRP